MLFLFSCEIPSSALVVRWLDCKVSSLTDFTGLSLCGLLEAEARWVVCVCVCAGLEWVSMRLLLLLLWAGSPLLCLGSRTKSHLLIKLDTPGAVYDGKNRNVTLMLLGNFFTSKLPAFLFIQKTTTKTHKHISWYFVLPIIFVSIKENNYIKGRKTKHFICKF